MSKRKTKEQFIEELNDNNLEILGEYVNNKEKILVRYKNCGHEEMKAPIKLLRGQRCGKCKGKSISKSKTRTTREYEKSLEDKGISDIELLGEYKGSRKKIKVKNTNCGHIYEAIASNIERGSGCPVCHGMKDTNKFIEEIDRKYPNAYKINGKYKNNRTPISVTHRCGYTWNVIPKDLLGSERCPKCIKSKGELYIQKYLVDNGIEYESQFKIDDCRDTLPLPFDFMIIVNKKMKLIEFDGSQHYNHSELFNNKNVAEHDKIKNDYCLEHKIPLLRIPYWWLRSKRIENELDIFCK